jgi:hypothetical protein
MLLNAGGRTRQNTETMRRVTVFNVSRHVCGEVSSTLWQLWWNPIFCRRLHKTLSDSTEKRPVPPYISFFGGQMIGTLTVKVKVKFIRCFVAKTPTFNEGLIAVVLMVPNKTAPYKFSFRTIVVFLRILFQTASRLSVRNNHPDHCPSVVKEKDDLFIFFDAIFLGHNTVHRYTCCFPRFCRVMTTRGIKSMG